jgi:hypothetical protein
MTQDRPSAPREWWVDDLTSRVCAPWNHETLGVQTMKWPDSDKVIHVIEKSAYDALKKERDHWRDCAEKHADFINRLIERVLALEKECGREPGDY